MEVNSLRNSRDSYVVVYDRFMKLYPKEPQKVYCFMEGYMDDKYYGLRVDKYFSQKKVYLCCGGKAAVLHMRRVIAASDLYDDCKCLYFTDRDFDGPLNDSYVFETPCYSIENFFVQKEVLEEILKREFHIYELNPNYQTILNLYEEAFESFHHCIVLLNAWIYYQREQERRQKLRKKVHLDILGKKELYRFCLDVTSGKSKADSCYSLENLQRWFPDSYQMTPELLYTYRGKLLNMDAEKDFRGKQEFEFFCLFIEKVKEQINLCRKEKKNRGVLVFTEDLRTVSLDLSGGKEEHMSKLTSYAVTPAELEDYLSAMQKVYHNGV